MKILVSGATGLVGKAVVRMLVAGGHEVRALTRGKARDDSVQWNVETGELDIAALKKFGSPETIIHLAGENIAARRWSAKQKERIRDSRVEATHKLAAFLVRSVPTLKVFVGASAIGYYGDRGDEVLTEESERGAAVRMVFGEMGEALLLSSARVVPERLERAGFRFRDRDLGAVLAKN